MTWVNPVPVSVILVPVNRGGRTGLLVVRRGIEPGIGKLALAGGFVDAEESWENAGAREVEEETGLSVSAADIQPFWFTSTEPRPNRVLLFGTAPALEISLVSVFEPTNETTERGLVFGPKGLDEVFAFSLHCEAAAQWFFQEDLNGSHDYTPF